MLPSDEDISSYLHKQKSGIWLPEFVKHVKIEVVKWGFKTNLYFTQKDAVFKLFGIYSVRKSVRFHSPDEIALV